MREAIRQGPKDLPTASLLITYIVSKALAISPLEVMKMPANMVMDFLYIHRNFEELKADTIEQEMKKVKKDGR